VELVFGPGQVRVAGKHFDVERLARSPGREYLQRSFASQHSLHVVA
jgi:hypothetical protein